MAAFEGNPTFGDPFFQTSAKNQKKNYPYQGLNGKETHISWCAGDFYFTSCEWKASKAE